MRALGALGSSAATLQASCAEQQRCAAPSRQCRASWVRHAAPRPGRRRALRTTAAADEDAGSVVPDALPIATAGSDWRAFRAQLVASAARAGSSSAPAAEGAQAWAHSLPRPEKGCLLLANPLMFHTSQQYFYMSVILVFEHDERGSAGIILNRPTEHLVGQLARGAEGLQPEFNACRVMLGGDVGAEVANLMHGIPGLEGSVEVIEGLYLGGFHAAKQGLAEGRFSADQFKLFTRIAGWGPGQLESECRAGVWMPVSASQAAILSPPAETAKDPVVGVWHYVAQLAGGDLAMLSREVRGVPDPEIARAAAGGYASQQQQGEEEAGQGGSPASASSSGAPSGSEQEEERGDEDSSDGGSGGGGGSPWQQQRRRSKLPETDYRDGAGI